MFKERIKDRRCC